MDKKDKIQLIKNRDLEVLIQGQEWEVTATGRLVNTDTITLADYDKIQLFVARKNDNTPVAKYTNVTPTPEGWYALTTPANKISFTIFSEDTKEMASVDLYYTVALYKEDGRVDGEDLKGQTEPEYLVTLTEASGYTEE